MSAARVSLLILAALIVGAIGLYALRPAPVAPLPPTSDLSSSVVAKSLAAKIAPRLQQTLSDRKPEIIASAGALPARAAVRLGFPVALREVPTLTEAGVAALLDQLGGMSLPELARTIAAHNRSVGRASHPSLLRAAQR